MWLPLSSAASRTQRVQNFCQLGLTMTPYNPADQGGNVLGTKSGQTHQSVLGERRGVRFLNVRAIFHCE
jgi:hypothetical protein